MKILCGIPCLYNGETCLRAFSVVDEENVDLLIIDNGSDTDVKYSIDLVKNAYSNVKVIKHNKNIFVNPAWNEILAYFLNNGQYDQLIIMNSDLILSPRWSNFIEDGISCLTTDGSHTANTEAFEGTPGVFIHLNKEMARLVYPIPEEIKIWYGDLWIYSKLRKAGYKTIIKAGLIANHYHGGSQSCQKLPEFQEIIEQDKIAWVEIEKTL